MGFLRKLAELVVEFPEEQRPAAAARESEGDVLASIEKIRGELEVDLESQRRSFEHEADLQADRPVTDSQAAPSSIALPPVLSVEEVYSRAKLDSTPEALNIYAVERMLSDPEIADLPLETRARSVRMALRSMGKELAELIEDAARRDQALEVYEQFLSEAIDKVSSQVSDANTLLQAEIDRFVREKTAQIEANRAALFQARQGLDHFRTAKNAEEERLFQTIAPFVAPGSNPVGIGSNDIQQGS